MRQTQLSRSYRARDLTTLEELRQALAFEKTDNSEWLFPRLGYRTPAEAREGVCRRPAA